MILYKIVRQRYRTLATLHMFFLEDFHLCGRCQMCTFFQICVTYYIRKNDVDQFTQISHTMVSLALFPTSNITLLESTLNSFKIYLQDIYLQQLSYNFKIKKKKPLSQPR